MCVIIICDFCTIKQIIINSIISVNCSSRSSCSGTISATEVFQISYAALVKSLPMNDCIFIADLFTNGLLTTNLKENLKLQKTAPEKATDFLDNLHRISDDFNSVFNKLLTVMGNSEYGSVKDLCKSIRAKMNKNGDTIKGNCKSAPKGFGKPPSFEKIH